MIKGSHSKEAIVSSPTPDGEEVLLTTEEIIKEHEELIQTKISTADSAQQILTGTKGEPEAIQTKTELNSIDIKNESSKMLSSRTQSTFSNSERMIVQV